MAKGEAKAIILKKGNDPNCVHHEFTKGDIGTCIKCGRVKKYPPDLSTVPSMSLVSVVSPEFLRERF